MGDADPKLLTDDEIDAVTGGNAALAALAALKAQQQGSTDAGAPPAVEPPSTDQQQAMAAYQAALAATNQGAITDAQMEEESTKLKAMQTQQQLAQQALQIANNATSNIMTLYRG